MNTPNAKTAASVSTHLKTVDTNLTQVMQGARPFMKVSVENEKFRICRFRNRNYFI